jgi:hypothetical protein
MTEQEARRETLRIADALKENLVVLRSTQDQARRVELWKLRADAYGKLYALVETYDLPALDGVVGLPVPISMCKALRPLALAVAEAEQAGATGEERCGQQFKLLEGDPDARRLLERFAEGDVKAGDLAYHWERLEEIARDVTLLGAYVPA